MSNTNLTVPSPQTTTTIPSPITTILTVPSPKTTTAVPSPKNITNNTSIKVNNSKTNFQN